MGWWPLCRDDTALKGAAEHARLCCNLRGMCPVRQWSSLCCTASMRCHDSQRPIPRGSPSRRPSMTLVRVAMCCSLPYSGPHLLRRMRQSPNHGGSKGAVLSSSADCISPGRMEPTVFTAGSSVCLHLSTAAVADCSRQPAAAHLHSPQACPAESRSCPKSRADRSGAARMGGTAVLGCEHACEG